MTLIRKLILNLKMAWLCHYFIKSLIKSGDLQPLFWISPLQIYYRKFILFSIEEEKQESKLADIILIHLSKRNLI